MDDVEVWKQVDGFPRYRISNWGNIIGTKGILKKPQTVGNGYQAVVLYGNGIEKMKYVHHLVLEHFKCKRPIGMECNHIDCNKRNNVIDNLEWVDRKKHVLHSMKNGLIKSTFGENSGKNKLNNNDVIAIRTLYEDYSFFMKDIAEFFDVGKTAIRDIIIRHTWRHL